MAKLPKLQFVKFTRSKGRVYAYFNTGKKVNGNTVFAALPPFSSAGFFDSYAAMLGARTKRTQSVYTVADLVDAFERSDDFKRLKPNTQKAYSATAKRMVDQLGGFSIAAVERRHIREIVENRIGGNGARNIFLAVVGVVYRFAIERDLAEKNPAKGIRKFAEGQHEPWPDELLAAGLAADNDRTRLAIHLLYHTGQRIGDVMAMRWSDIRNGAIMVEQQKTGKPLRIPITRALEAELAKAERRGVTILTRHDGKPLTASRLRQEIKDFAAALGFNVVPHGLRKNAVNTLLQAGCTIAQVGAITGQSFQTVEHYARRVDQHALGTAAIGLLEQSAIIQTELQT